MSQGVLDAFITEVIAGSLFEEMDRIYLTNRVWHEWEKVFWRLRLIWIN